jgi:hypothetical protein
MMAFTETTADFLVSDQGSIVMFTPLTPAAEQWCSEHLPEDAPMFGTAYCVERRFAGNVWHGILNDGLEII